MKLCKEENKKIMQDTIHYSTQIDIGPCKESYRDDFVQWISYGMCVFVYERERDSRYTRSEDTENRVRKLMYIDKGERLNYLQGGSRVLYIVTLSLH